MTGSHSAAYTNPTTRTLDPFQVAAGLLKNDRFLLLPLLLLLAIPTLIDLFIPLSPRNSGIYLSMVDRLLHLVVVSAIALRWRRRLESPQGSRVSNLRVVGRIVAIGVFTYLIVAVPLFGMAFSGETRMASLWVLLLGMGCWYSLRIYFYFVAASVFGMATLPAVRASIELSRGNATAAVRSLIAPAALTLLLIGLCMAPAPDGRSLWTIGAASIAEGVFWILSCYTGLAFGLVLFDDVAWRSAGLNPYRAERLATLHTQGGGRAARLLSTRSGLMLLGVSICFLTGNLLRQLHEPPAAEVTIEKVTLADYTIRVELLVRDSQYNFRGFSPAAFSVASKTGFAQSQRLTTATDEADGKEVLTTLASSGETSKRLYLTFQTNKTAASLRALDNMWLWYKLQPLLPIQTGLAREENQDAPEEWMS